MTQPKYVWVVFNYICDCKEHCQKHYRATSVFGVYADEKSAEAEAQKDIANRWVGRYEVQLK